MDQPLEEATPLVEKSVIAQQFAVIAVEENDRVLELADGIQMVDQTAELRIEKLDHRIIGRLDLAAVEGFRRYRRRVAGAHRRSDVGIRIDRDSRLLRNLAKGSLALDVRWTKQRRRQRFGVVSVQIGLRRIEWGMRVEYVYGKQPRAVRPFVDELDGTIRGPGCLMVLGRHSGTAETFAILVHLGRRHALFFDQPAMEGIRVGSVRR